MGITWKITMVLLSTLAALVIIVHSAEEEYERQYRRGMRSRSLDTGTRRFEQPWRTLEVEPVMQQSRSRELEDVSPEESMPPRRRPGRKRKRRPDPSSTEESTERFSYSEDYNRPRDDFRNEHQTSEIPERRRKKMERRLKWAESLEEDRPLRRRQRRKRPALEDAPELSEFNDYRPGHKLRQVETDVTTEYVLNDERQEYYKDDNLNKKSSESFESREVLLEIGDSLPSKINKKDSYDYLPDEHFPVQNEDSSHSEFSSKDLIAELQTEKKRKVVGKRVEKPEMHNKNNIEKSKGISPIDPLTLKDILKKSNGTSLSEILQQHNLSLTDLLHGKELALSILNSGRIQQISTFNKTGDFPGTKNKPKQVNSDEVESSAEQLLIKSETKYLTETVTEIQSTLPTTTLIEDEVNTEVVPLVTTTAEPKEEEKITLTNIRRFPNGLRRKQRVRPVINNYKSQINRDMLALTARKYFYNNRRRNATKSQEWKDVIPLMKNVTEIVGDKPKSISTISKYQENIEDTTVYEETDNITTTVPPTDIDDTTAQDEVSKKKSALNETIVVDSVDVTNCNTNETDKLKSIPSIPEKFNTVELRREAINNVLKKKRRKQKYSTTEPPQQDDSLKNIFEMPNLVSSSEIIARTQATNTNLDDVTILEDFITTETPRKYENKPTKLEDKPIKEEERQRRRDKSRKIRYTTRGPNRFYKPVISPTTTEETAKIEIEEILNDSGANARLSKILMERNMTLNELVEHRERGSSHVHLADIFHNASKEPNPPEPFLSKSAIEPISKETYPLRALLDAHDTTTKAPTIEPVHDDYIPIKMDFTNNVDSNVDNMGIMSLFNNITKTDSEDGNSIRKDSQGMPYSTSIIVVNTTDDEHNETETVRESRVMHSINSNPEDIVGWNEIFSLMRRSYENKTKELTGTYLDGLVAAETLPNQNLEEDVDGDGLIVLDDLQRLNEFKITPGEKQEVVINEITETPMNTPTLDKQNHFMDAKSVTLATASIFGIALVLFLLTYIAYRWRQQRVTVDKSSYPDEVIPTPVFENRKGHKNNSSTRSISPMLTSNIYTLSTLDSQHGKESPDYMWDSLRKPFQ